ncbi:hypothetical protein D917_00331 [Trichinella nativa]|uniref:Apple domain-containing protein n=1 Tax=Trichinella nativa TaxID=6335 RepID=A0A1Y3EF82_9BILA|nr:hypothetical protein D917_00331 [Trichinella nativa]
MTCVLDQLKVDNSTLRLYEMRKVWSKSFDECILMCNLLLPENKCNAIKYSQNLMKCYLLVGHIISKPTETQNESHDVTFVYGCSEGDVKVNSIVIEATHNISYELRAECCAATAPCELKILQLDSKRISGPSVEQAERISKESYVHLYRYLELCKVNIIHNRKIENVTSVQIISNVRSVNRCLHFCRPWLRYLSYCSIIYSRHNYKCELLKRNAQRSNVRSINRRSNLVELLNCRAERQNQRKYNPPPVRYYLQKIGEICVLEFYNATQLSGFNPTETFENVENIKSCIYACRIRYTSYICLAIKYTMKKQCTLLRQEMNHEIYNVESQSLFAEILFCEPGTLVDEILDF